MNQSWLYIPESVKLIHQLKTNENQALMTSIENINTSKFGKSKSYLKS